MKQIISRNRWKDILETPGGQSAQFFLAASFYHSKKVSFHRAAQLAGLSFEEFKVRLKEQFSTGYILADETAMDDLQTVDKLLSE